jgi:hypothetical protein
MRFFQFLVIVGILLSRSALAHHSFAASRDLGTRITLAGVVTKVEWANPHMYFVLFVKNDEGKRTPWICEAAGPNMLSRRGWARDLLRVGETVTVVGHPARGGGTVSAGEVILPDGRKLPGGTTDERSPQP